MRTEKTYNGWTNYATWRVNLEMFDGLDVKDYAPECVKADDAYGLSQILAEYAENIIDEDGEGLAVDYARVFLRDVNWYEIAEHLLNDIKADAT